MNLLPGTDGASAPEEGSLAPPQGAMRLSGATRVSRASRCEVLLVTFRYTRRQNALTLINQNNSLANLVNSTILQSEQARQTLGKLEVRCDRPSLSRVRTRVPIGTQKIGRGQGARAGSLDAAPV